MPSPNIGKLNSFGYALQTQAGLYVAPANWAKIREGDGYLPDYIERVDNYSHGSIYEAPAVYGGVDYQGRKATMEATMSDLQFFLAHMYGAASAGTITPALANNWADGMPMQPWSAQLQVAGDSTKAVRVTDAQNYELTVDIPEDRSQNATMALGFHAINAEEISAGVTSPTRPAFGTSLSRMHAGFTYGATTLTAGNRWKITKNQIIFRRPIKPLAADGELIAGFEVDENQPAGVEIAISMVGQAGNFATIMADAKTKAIKDAVWSMVNGAQKVEVVGKFQVKTRVTPMGQGIITCEATIKAVQTSPTAVPFTIKVS